MNAPDTTAHESGALEALTGYYRAFSTLDVQALKPYFNEPALLIGPQGVIAAPNFACVAGVLGPAMEGLRSKEFGRSELSVGRVDPLSANSTLVTGVAIRYRRDEQEMENVGVTYVMHKAQAGWKIAVLILHDPQGVTRSKT